MTRIQKYRAPRWALLSGAALIALATLGACGSDTAKKSGVVDLGATTSTTVGATTTTQATATSTTATTAKATTTSTAAPTTTTTRAVTTTTVKTVSYANCTAVKAA